jgi:hypothetical protein
MSERLNTEHLNTQRLPFCSREGTPRSEIEEDCAVTKRRAAPSK